MKQENGNLRSLKSIIEKRLLGVPPEVKRFFPPILSRSDVSLYHVSTESYIILAFVDANEKERIDKFTSHGCFPFPGLIRPEDASMGTAFGLSNARNAIVHHVAVKDLYAFSLGKDCTILLYDFSQSIDTKEFGRCEYRVDLAYIISFGDEIHRDNLSDHFEDLLAFSFKHWRTAYGRTE